MSTETCPACGGRGTIAVGVHDAQCAACGGTGSVKTTASPSGGKRAVSKPDS
jgi:DnaJ-class molecular chaperone